MSRWKKRVERAGVPSLPRLIILTHRADSPELIETVRPTLGNPNAQPSVLHGHGNCSTGGGLPLRAFFFCQPIQ